jgi:four helix bundle protein
VWKKSHDLALSLHALAPHLRQPEAWPQKDQLFRASISIPSNIAEGSGRGSDLDFPPLKRPGTES